MNTQKQIGTASQLCSFLPLVLLFLSGINGFVAISQPGDTSDKASDKTVLTNHGIKTQGLWTATIENEKLDIHFKKDGDNENYSSNTTFSLNEFSSLPNERQGEFKLTREAGTILFTGKFEGDKGSGKYHFIPEPSYNTFMLNQGLKELQADDLFVFFLVNLKKDYINVLHNYGYTDFTKNDLIPLAALGIDEAYIKFWKQNGYDNVTLSDLIPLNH